MWLHLVTEFYVINSTEFVTKMTKFDLNLFLLNFYINFSLSLSQKITMSRLNKNISINYDRNILSFNKLFW